MHTDIHIRLPSELDARLIEAVPDYMRGPKHTTIRVSYALEEFLEWVAQRPRPHNHVEIEGNQAG